MNWQYTIYLKLILLENNVANVAKTEDRNKGSLFFYQEKLDGS